MVGIAPKLQDIAEFYTLQNALDWQLDPIAATDIETRLASYGFDQHTVSMEVYVQAREAFSIFEALLNGTQLRRLLLLKELNSFRRDRSERIFSGNRFNGATRRSAFHSPRVGEAEL
ncbi:hypothetical protein [Bradyrhizobium sp. McL0616]|uniref:hypothetical protein n=1 Tax=Bradyrhizobium sp. McL0616 TaxID=3415674 RepID=UPI003CEDA59F